jgi:hypothetical protein
MGIKNTVITLLIAIAVAIFVPRDLREAATLIVRTGIGLIQFGLALEPNGYDADLSGDVPLVARAIPVPVE